MTETPTLHDRLREKITERRDLARKAVGSVGDGNWTYEDGDYNPIVRVSDDETWDRSVPAAIWQCGDELDGCPEVARELRAEGRHIAANDPAFVIRACERDLRELDQHRPFTLDKVASEFGDAVASLFAPMMAPQCTHGRAGILVEFFPWPCGKLHELAEVYAVEIGEPA